MDRADTLIVARDSLFREGFARILSADFAVVGTAGLDGALAEIVGGLRPRLLIVAAAAVDFAALQKIRSDVPTVKIVVLVDVDQPIPFTVPAHFDFDGYILTDVPPETFRLSLGLVMAGQAVMPSGFANSIVRKREAAAPINERALTPREEQVLRSLSRGRSNKEIARELSMSAATVKVHLKGILRKLQVRNRTEAAVWTLGRPVA